MAVFLVKYLLNYIPCRVSRLQSVPALSNSIGNWLLLSKQAAPEETTGEILNKILANAEDPSVSREELSIRYIQKLCAAGDLQTASKLPKKLQGDHIFLGPRAYNYILVAADRKNDTDIVSQVFKDLLVSCGSISLSSYLIVARAFGKNNKLSGFIRELCEMELPCNDIVLNRLIFAFAKCGHVDNALLVFACMKDSQCKPNLVTYNTVLAILVRIGRVHDMLCEFSFMKSVDLSPDIVTYNTVLNGLRKKGRLDLSIVYFKEMTEKGIQPDMLTFKALIESLGRSGHIKQALGIFSEMKLRGFQPSIHIYRALVSSLKKTGKMELALKFSEEMKKLAPDSVVRDVQCKNK